MKKIVIDASVSLKLIFEEKDSEQARLIQKEFENGNILLVAPNLWEYEIVNALASAVRFKKITFVKSRRFLKAILEVKPEILPFFENLHSCLENARKYQISAYDSAYVTLAKENGFLFVSADDKLVTKVNDQKIVVGLASFASKVVE